MSRDVGRGACLQKRLMGKIRTDLFCLQRKRLQVSETEQGVTEGPRHQHFQAEIVAVSW